MRNAKKIAGLGLVLGAAVTLAAMPASARGPLGDRFGGAGDFGGRGDFFATDFAGIDANGDGQITEEDLVAGAEARFAEVDTDGDGALSAEEFAASVKARIEARMAESGRTSPEGWDIDEMASRMAARILGARDADKDGAVSLEELAPVNGFGRLIDRFDTDDDNAISQAEYDAAKQEIQDRMARRDDRGRGSKRGFGHGGGRW